MTRGMTSQVYDAVQAEVAAHAVAVELDFDGGVVRLVSTPFNITIDGSEFLGVGELGSISEAEEGGDLQSYSMTVELSGIPRDAIATSLTENYQGRAATIWDVPLNENTNPVASPFVIFRGRMDQMTVSHGETSAVSVSLLNRLADWDRARILRYSDEEQQRRFPGDFGMQYAAAMETREIVWPGRDWFKNHPNA